MLYCAWLCDLAEKEEPRLAKQASFSLGVDGGGTSTTAVLVDTQTRTEIARTTSTSTNWHALLQGLEARGVSL